VKCIADEILRKILPDNVEVPTGFETIGHVAHLNLRPEHLPFKQIIGQVLLDKNPRLRTIVNKTSSISDKFRVFPLELLAGEPNYVAELVRSSAFHICRTSLKSFVYVCCRSNKIAYLDSIFHKFIGILGLIRSMNEW
jgi:hypothetical protein